MNRLEQGLDCSVGLFTILVIAGGARMEIIRKEAAYVVGRGPGVIFDCNLHGNDGQYRSLCPSASERAKQVVSKLAIEFMPKLEQSLPEGVTREEIANDRAIFYAVAADEIGDVMGHAIVFED